MIQFGTGGWRAIIGDDFIRENIVKVATGLAKLAGEEGKTDKPIPIGYDRRFLSDKAAKWVAEVLAANGIKVWFMKRSAPTPLVMFTGKHNNLHYGVEITASHNPAEYNGIKIFIHDGRDADVATTARLEALINATGNDEIKAMPFDKAVTAGMIEFPDFLFNDFIDSIISRLDINAIRKKGPRILFNPMHGSGTYPLMVLMYTARCTVDLMNANKDAFFGGSLPAPTAHTLSDLARRVVEEKYDLGIAVDGDGDRLGIIDNDGTYIDANQILAMLYYYLHEYRGWKGPVVRNLATTHMLDMIAKDFGEECFEVPVGFKWISAKLDESDAVLGGESSGGLTVRGHIYGKDSVYAAMLFVEMISAIGKSPSEFWQELTEKYGSFEMVEANLRFLPEDKARINNLLMVEKKVPDFGKEIAKLSYEDGFKVTFADNSFVICRFSGTEPLLRVFAEGATADAARALITTMKDFIGI
ncbi:MAG: phosphoglucomutase/phosphomannomutase family protein [Clostridia bacterium]|nr:phosphoglucomutase/phosphomannomutase family protein [Clostridia bacterium]